MVNQQAMKDWVAKLRSGEYEQGRGYLATIDGKFCCLGVLCEVAINSGLNIEKKDVGGVYSYGNERGEDDVALPASVYEWAGFNLTQGREIYIQGEAQETLTAMNDFGDRDFDDIADVIEDQFIND